MIGADDPLVGARVGGYRIEGLAGRGGMGTVYRATQIKLQRLVALKVISGHAARDEAFRERFKRESLIAASVEHPNVIPVIEADESGECLFISMRYVDGSDLAREIHTHGPLSAERSVEIVQQVAAGLAAAHERGLVHRDVKPANVLLAGDPEHPHVYVTDFGIAQRVQDPRLTGPGLLLGTLDYMAPEQLRGEAIDARADVYALGCLLYETLMGEVPYPRPDAEARTSAHLYQSPPRISDRRPDLPLALDSIIITALAKKPEERFASTTELAHAAASALSGPHGAAAFTEPTQPPRPLRVHNLPVQPTPVVGRRRETAQVVGLLGRAEVRLLTLVGPGGIGKTRLALEAAAEVVQTIQAAHFVNLAPLSDPALVMPTIARVLGVAEEPGENLLDTVCAKVCDDEILLLLDNFEQVGEAAAAVAALRSGTGRLKLLVTSRAPLHVSGEFEYAVPPLAANEAVELFAVRARAVAPNFKPTNRAIIGEICRRLDELPLAIELAAARIKLLPERALLERLGKRFEVLTGGPRDHDQRQRTLRATIDWSHDLLSPTEQKLFRRLAPFAGGVALEAIERVCDPDSELDVFDLVTSLVDKSLLSSHDAANGSPRVVMLESVHAYAAERLAQSGESERFFRLHADWFFGLVTKADDELRGPDEVHWHEILELEHDNLRAAMRWSAQESDGRLALGIASRLWRFWLAHGHLSEGRRWLEIALSPAPADATGARALRGLASLAMEQGDLDGGEEAARRALKLDREVGDERSKLQSLGVLADFAAVRGNLVGARDLYEQAAEAARSCGDGEQLAASLYYLGEVARLQGDLDTAHSRLSDALGMFAEMKDGLAQGAVARALAEVALGRGDHERAFALLDEAAAMHLSVRYVGGLLALIDVYARLLAEVDEPEAAIRLWGSYDQAREQTGRALDQPQEAAVREAAVTSARTTVGEDAFRGAFAAGMSMSIEEAVMWARERDRGQTRPV